MELRNTLELQEDVTDSVTKFKALIYDNEHVVFVVIGTKAKCEDLVQIADEYADTVILLVERKVIWLKNHALLKDSCLELLKTHYNFKEDQYKSVLAFVLSPKKHQVKYIFWNNNDNDNNIKGRFVGRAYAAASESET